MRDRKLIRQLIRVDGMINAMEKQFQDIRSMCSELEDFYYCDLNEEEITVLNGITKKIDKIKSYANEMKYI